MKVKTLEEIREEGQKKYDWDINSTPLRNHIVEYARSETDFTYKELDEALHRDSSSSTDDEGLSKAKKEMSDTLRWLVRNGKLRQKTVVRTVTIARKGYEYIVPKEQVGSETEGE